MALKFAVIIHDDDDTKRYKKMESIPTEMLGGAKSRYLW